MTIFNREPALILGLVQALLAGAIAFGVELTPTQVAAVMAVSAAVASVIVRSRVTPVEHDLSKF